MSLKNSNDTIGNRTCNLPVCSVVPKPLRHRALQTCVCVCVCVCVYIYIYIMGTGLVNKKARTVASTSSWKPYGSVKKMSLYQSFAILERSALEFRAWLSTEGFCYNFHFIAAGLLAERSCYFKNSYCWESSLLLLIFILKFNDRNYVLWLTDW